LLVEDQSWHAPEIVDEFRSAPDQDNAGILKTFVNYSTSFVLTHRTSGVQAHTHFADFLATGVGADGTAITGGGRRQNRANGRMMLFEDDGDYLAFQCVLAQACDRVRMRLLAYCVMPNHWHLVV
jgi:hypothetical protein